MLRVLNILLSNLCVSLFLFFKLNFNLNFNLCGSTLCVRIIHGLECFSALAIWGSVEWTCMVLFTHSPTKGHWSCLHFFVIQIMLSPLCLPVQMHAFPSSTILNTQPINPLGSVLLSFRGSSSWKAFS